MGSVRQLTSLSGAVTDTYSYDAFGNLLASTGTTPNNFLYRGEQYDSALGLEYLRARYYNPATGRFLSKDPWGGDLADPATLHKYSYVGGNPINYHDPTGWDAAIEEGELDSEISENKATEEGLEKTRDEVDCILDTATATLTAIVTGDTSGTTLLSIAIEGAKCTAEAKRNKGSKEPTTCPLCFAAGTPIHTDHGDVPVEKIEEGDEVLSRSRATGKLEYQRVTALTPKHQDSLLDIRVEGEAEPLRPSTSHPFWVKRGDDSDGAWIAAGKMRVGDLVQTIQGDWRRVVAITPEKDAQTVYNFTVDINHDYFVGDTGFLVHNKPCGCRLPDEDLHHIVARNDPRAALSRTILGLAGISINSDGNLVNLLRPFHQRLHTDEYFEAVESKLRCGLRTGGPGAIQSVLDDISDQLGNGTWIPR